MKRKLTVLTAVLGMLAISGLAMAATEDDREDTTFNFGYDEQYRILVWGTSDVDGLYDCAIEGETAVTYGAEENDVIEIELLEQDGTVLLFPPTAAEDLADGLEPVEEDFAYNGSDDECGVVGTSVEGPNQQVNHGMFMRAFNQMYDGPGRGCLVRFLAQSDLGKGDQQINVPDVDPDADQVAEGDVGSVDFTSLLADCKHGNRPGDADSETDGEGNGNRPDDPGAQGRANAAEKKGGNGNNGNGNGNGNNGNGNGNGPGNSGNAPGRNR